MGLVKVRICHVVHQGVAWLVKLKTLFLRVKAFIF